MRVWGMQLQWASSGRATALGVVYAIGLVGLLYWFDFWGFSVGLTVKVLLSVSVLWAYGTSIVGIRVVDGWRPWVFYMVGLAVLNLATFILLQALGTSS